MKFIQSLLLLPVAVLSLAAPAMAQTNIAVFNEERVLAESAVGQHVQTRLAAIAQEVEAEMQALTAPVAQENEALNAETASMNPAAIQARPDLMQRIETLNQQLQALEVQRRIRQQELAATQQSAMRPIYEAMSPILEEVVEARDIDILLRRSNLVFSSEEVDISAEVISILNTRLPTVAVNRVRLPQDGQAAQ
ncbi:MAG: OmpH family outer membrane protein [Maricaulis sp.]|uniref:OmpH family outer membrane protein n=1 Tax=Maricaulis sp. TaxID=1486257 RepID=UPI001B19978C|nr:OmpH family outer membrane protein [Maricaulis sp.]MEC9250867.1 OmpH family outer membrane protein [Pseudomonadota bacterium]MBO6728152.1 OmpH family outer membrane protein [Maricaulis sp.]MBO6846572.1 OmpH family outer membrane protein [Maricaulis sp.]MBO6877191.1 OmpH family outer membrane protein [Maricaulis sp.]MDM7982847.1 OmpH family outer membrane protein [Maricaulis sp.]